MRDGECPKCGAHAVHLVSPLDGNPGGVQSVRLGVTIFFTAAMIDQYVCTCCGYLESYVSDESRLPGLAAKYPHVPAVPGKTTRHLPPLPSR